MCDTGDCVGCRYTSHAGYYGYSTNQPKVEKPVAKTRKELQVEIDALQATLESLPPDPLPTGTIEFSAYVHDSDGRFTLGEDIGTWSKISPEDFKRLEQAWDHLEAIYENERHRPFYEVELRCTLNLETGEIKLLRAVL